MTNVSLFVINFFSRSIAEKCANGSKILLKKSIQSIIFEKEKTLSGIAWCYCTILTTVFEAKFVILNFRVSMAYIVRFDMGKKK